MRTIRVVRSSGKLNQDIEVGPHHLMSDEPLEVGGEDKGPSPHEYLAVALGTCTATTLQMYAQRKTWPLQNSEVSVLVSHVGDLTTFDRKIHLVGALDDTQRARLLEIANHCPVHKALTGQIKIETALV